MLVGCSPAVRHGISAFRFKLASATWTHPNALTRRGASISSALQIAATPLIDMFHFLSKLKFHFCQLAECCLLAGRDRGSVINKHSLPLCDPHNTCDRAVPCVPWRLSVPRHSYCCGGVQLFQNSKKWSSKVRESQICGVQIGLGPHQGYQTIGCYWLYLSLNG